MDIKAALTNKDRKSILNSCEFGEDVAVKNYKDALENNPAGTPLNKIIYIQHDLIKAEHDKIKVLRDVPVNVEA